MRRLLSALALAAVLALAASVSWGVADFLGGLKSRTIPLVAVLALAQPIGLALVAAIAFASGHASIPASALWAVPASFLGAAGIAAFYRGMAIGTISIVAPIAATGAAIPVVVGIALGDRPSPLQLAGFPLAIAGVILASRETGPNAAGARLGAGVVWALVAAIGFGGYFVPMHEASEDDFLAAALVFKLSIATLLLAVFATVRPRTDLRRSDAAAIAAIGISDTGGNVFFAAASTLGLVSVVSVLASLYPVTTVALAWLYLGERIGRTQRIGVVVTLVGVVAVSAG